MVLAFTKQLIFSAITLNFNLKVMSFFVIMGSIVASDNKTSDMNQWNHCTNIKTKEIISIAMKLSLCNHLCSLYDHITDITV